MEFSLRIFWEFVNHKKFTTRPNCFFLTDVLREDNEDTLAIVDTTKETTTLWEVNYHLERLQLNGEDLKREFKEFLLRELSKDSNKPLE